MIKLKKLLPECESCERNWNHGPDHEGAMAGNEIKDAISNASKIQNLVQPGDNLPGWISAYITLAADYLHSVAEYLEGQSTEMPQEPTPGYAIYEGKSSKTVNRTKTAKKH